MFKPPTPSLGRVIQEKQHKVDAFRIAIAGVVKNGYEVAAITNGTDLSKQVLELVKTMELWEDILFEIPPSFGEHLFIVGCWLRFFATLPNWQAAVKSRLFRDEFAKVREGVYDGLAAWAARERKDVSMEALEFLNDDLEDVSEPVDWPNVLRETFVASSAETNDARAPEEVWEMIEDVAPFINLYASVQVIEKLEKDLEDMDKSMEEKFPDWSTKFKKPDVAKLYADKLKRISVGGEDDLTKQVAKLQQEIKRLKSENDKLSEQNKNRQLAESGEHRKEIADLQQKIKKLESEKEALLEENKELR